MCVLIYLGSLFCLTLKLLFCNQQSWFKWWVEWWIINGVALQSFLVHTARNGNLVSHFLLCNSVWFHGYVVQVSAYAGCAVLRTASNKAFRLKGRSLMAPDIIEHLAEALEHQFPNA